MTLWRRAPRSVYEVYDEEQYLSDEGEPIGEPESVSEGFGQTAVSQTAVSYNGPRTVRLFALGLLSVVTVSAAAIIAVGVLRHPNAAPTLGVARRDRVYPTRPSAAFESATPTSKVRSGWTSPTHTTVKAGAISVIAASVVPQVRPQVDGHSESSTRQQGFARDWHSVVHDTTAQIQASSDVEDKAVWGAGEPSLTNEARIDGEFGFER